ncbi:hypothetical protein Pla175_21070 [Pirellulimonas nuda]|uniref:Uncharacterized protein n=1 Tax=Pirellulimonas nuda TaxID=2528009 RepID=A0A518DBB5_9BACT|nr:hypothetical protein [Pirellulimonas nuda]QDU88726.1 hypothetical protein Pla175_21070 [Pirellulimonas nuda]
MASLPSTPHSRPSYRLTVNSYDRSSSALIALLLIVGVLVAGLVFIWYMTHFKFRSEIAIEFKPIEFASRPADAAMGVARDLEPPGQEDAPELTEPKLQDTLSALSDLSTTSALLSDEAVDSDTEAGKGSGLGDSRRAGDGGEGLEGEEPVRQIKYEPGSVDEYAQWYDFYKLELGVLDQQNNLIYYAKNLAGANPVVRSAPPDQEKRLYTINPVGSPLNTLDRRLAEKAGIGARGAFTVTFWPDEAARELLEQEFNQAESKKKQINEVQRSVFRVTRGGSGFQIALEDQVYYY